MRCCAKKKRTKEELLESLHTLARARNTKAAIEMKYSLDEDAEAALALRDGNREEARVHLQNAAEAKGRAQHEMALYQNAVGLIQAIDRAEFQNELSHLIHEGSENLQRIVDDTPDLEDLIESMKSPSKESLQEPLLLPSVPDRPLVMPESPPKRVRVLSTE